MNNFRISISIDEQFTKEELWPDGNAPENPTAKDVADLIRNCGGAKKNDWNLYNKIECAVWDEQNFEYVES
jgi:hypothetical protein